jgi:hypothetical protein
MIFSYLPLLIVENQNWQAYLYRAPDEDDDEIEDSDEEEEIKKIYEKVQKERYQQEKKLTETYLWIVVADKDSDIVRDSPKIQALVSD